MTMEEATKYAVDIFIEIYNKAGENIKGDFGKSLRARARNAPLLIATRGLLPYILYLASKASENNWEIKLDNIDYTKNTGGHQAQLYAITKFLQKEGLLSVTDTASLITHLKEMGVEDLSRYLLAEELVQEFTEHFKRLAEALLPSEREQSKERGR